MLARRKMSAEEWFAEGDRITSSLAAAQAEQDALTAGGVDGRQKARRLMEMVRLLHLRGYESLYLNAEISPSGGYWRFEVGAFRGGSWPDVDLRRVARGSIAGGYDKEVLWVEPSDPAPVMATKFLRKYRSISSAAKASNPEYVEWYRDMLEKSGPDGILVFSAFESPGWEYAFFNGGPAGLKLSMPRGYTHEHWKHLIYPK